MKVLVACEFSGIVRDAFKARGHDAWSCDLLPTEREGQHIQQDIFDQFGLWSLPRNFDLMIAHPPCTRLCNSGVMWLDKRNLWGEMKHGALFFKALLEMRILKIAIENPIPHKYATEIIGRKYDQIIQPYMFGQPERKATCLWLKGLPKLKPTNDVKAKMEALPKSEAQRIHWASLGPDRWKIRSRTFPGIADAMAEQWG